MGPGGDAEQFGFTYTKYWSQGEVYEKTEGSFLCCPWDLGSPGVEL